MYLLYIQPVPKQVVITFITLITITKLLLLGVQFQKGFVIEYALRCLMVHPSLDSGLRLPVEPAKA